VTLVVDASALVAIALYEPERVPFVERMNQATAVYISSVNSLEAGLAIVLRQRQLELDEFARWLAELRIEEAPVAGVEALRVYLRYGRGVHPAGLNMGDCYAYALAQQLSAPLLYKGDDFPKTDVRPAIQPT
jgi:ribonuclease VapC